MAERGEPAQPIDAFRLTMMMLAIVAFMYLAGAVLKTLTLSILLSFALAPAARVLERARLPRVLAVVLTVLLTLGALAGVGYMVGCELTALVERLPDYQENIELKLGRLLRPVEESAAAQLRSFAESLRARMEAPAPSPGAAKAMAGVELNPSVIAPKPIPKVQVVSQTSLIEQARSTAGPYLEFLGQGGFALVLVLFILIGREDLSDRLTALFGHNHVSLTTRTTQEIARRISRYLVTVVLLNSCYGFIIGVVLWLIGAPFSILWGSLAAILRFFPYVGPAAAFLLPFLFSFAHYDGWRQPLEVVVLFAVVEVVLAFYLEPVIYGRTTGISALSLLVAAMFMTWMWGTLGLLLSTPMTVCLVVLGKHVPSLRFFTTILGETAEIEPSLRFYQRLIALDEPSARATFSSVCGEQPRVRVFDDLLLKTLIRAERDAAHDELDDAKLAFIGRVVGEILDQLEGTPEFSLESTSLAQVSASSPDREPAVPKLPLLGLVLDKASDPLVLRMLGQLIAPSGLALEIVSDPASLMDYDELDSDPVPRIIVVSHLPPGGVAMAAFLVHRLKNRMPDARIIVGLWGHPTTSSTDSQFRLEVAAADVVRTLEDARIRIAAYTTAQPEDVLVDSSSAG